MKKIIFIRHGRAEDHSPDIPDFERSLTGKGKDITRLMARKLKEKEKDIGLLVTSPAFRAIETALIFAGEYDINPESIVIKSSIYFRFDERSFLEMVKSINESVATITLFGHNPSFTELAGHFSKETFDNIPKSGIVSLTFKVMTWSEIRRNTASESLFLKPKNLL